MKIALIIVCCWIVSFFFNGIESGLLAIDPVRLRGNVKGKVPAAVRLNRLLKRPERLLVTVLLVTNAADILGLLLLTRLLVQEIGYLGFVVAYIVALPVYLFVLGVLPKSLFRRFPFRALASLAGILELVSILFWPVLEFGSALGRLVLPRRAEKGKLFAAREELKQIATESEREGGISATERVMIHNVVDFGAIKTCDVMVPLPKVVAVAPETPIGEALSLGAESGVDRLPVITPNGEPVGLINVLDVLLDKNGQKGLNYYMRRIVMVEADEPAYRVVQRLRAARLGLAAVRDRDRKLQGIVTIEDLVRRLVSSTEMRTV
ncbi:MAG TPA: CNNM domain-containing protein [Chthoniobacterales bacterium]